jgi:hypothetical protein
MGSWQSGRITFAGAGPERDPQVASAVDEQELVSAGDEQ